MGQGFWFSGSNEGVDIPNSPIPGVGNSCTLECWINPTDVSQSHPIFDWNGLEVSIESGGVLAVRLQTYVYGSDTPVTNTFYAEPGLVVTNAFQHIAVTFIRQFSEATGAINGVVYLYYDGVQVGSVVGPGPSRAVGPSGDLYLGDSGRW